MERTNQQPDSKAAQEVDQHVFSSFADETPRREGGDDALAETDPADGRADEMVIVNEQREQKIVNTPPQPAGPINEGISNEDTVDRIDHEQEEREG